MALTSTGADHSTFGPSGAGPVLVKVPEGAGDACGARDAVEAEDGAVEVEDGAVEAEGVAAEAEGVAGRAAVSAFADCPKIADMMLPNTPMVHSLLDSTS